LVQERDNGSRQIALKATSFVEDKKGLDQVLLEVSSLTYLADYFLICTGTSTQHVQTLSDYLMEKLKESEVPLLHMEGYHDGRWVLMDFGMLIIHIFQSAEREFYNLERLWSKAPLVSTTSENYTYR